MKRLTLSLILTLGIVSITWAQPEGTNLPTALSGAITDNAAIDVLLTVISPLTVTAGDALDFGNITQGNSNVIDPTSASNTGERGSFTVSANAGATIEINGATTSAFASGITFTPTLSVGTTGITSGGDFSISGLVSAGAQSLTVFVGGTLGVGAAVPTGDYGAEYTLTVNYTSI